MTGNETNHRSALIPACMPEHLDNILLSEYALGWQSIRFAGFAKYLSDYLCLAVVSCPVRGGVPEYCRGQAKVAVPY